MEYLSLISTILYFSAAITLFIYGLNCYIMIYLLLSKRKTNKARQTDILKKHLDLLNNPNLPFVTTQIPVYNEYNVVERVITACCNIEYPKNKYEIQILDDSNDETSKLINKIVKRLRKKGNSISIIRRDDRTGFKAGALKLGMETAKGKFIAVFDADFIPPEDFLIKTIPFLIENKNLGLVQTRWGHINSNKSLLTKAQCIGMDGHFMVEQAARSWNNLYMNFNGTAGIWNRDAIIAGGGWQWDTLTEDMDLSYRMQIAGWETEYLADMVVPAEIPEDVNAFKSQQFRWAKGSIQTAKKILSKIMFEPVPIFKKIEAFFHLTHYMVHPLMLILSLFALPVLLTINVSINSKFFPVFGILMILATMAPSSLYIVSQKIAYKDWHKKIIILPFLVVMGVGLAVSNSIAVFQALIGHESDFIRTPKKGDFEKKKYVVKMPWIAILEIIVGLYCLVSLKYYLIQSKFLVGPFLAIYAAGYLFIGILTFAHNLGFSDSLPKLSLAKQGNRIKQNG